MIAMNDRLKRKLRQNGFSEQTIKEIEKWYGMEKIIALSKISGKAQITIPKDVMEILKVKTNDKILWFEDNGKIYVKKA